MTNEQTQIVFNIYYATELMNEGHKVIKTMQNPINPKFTCWLFAVDETFYSDFNEVKNRGKE